MTVSSALTDEKARLGRLLGFLDVDPTNLNLIADAASAALGVGELETAARLIDQHEAFAGATPALSNLKGLLALQGQRFADAAQIFEQLLVDHPKDTALRFNLAWCKAMLRDYEGALSLLDDEVLGAAPRSTSLKIQMMHHLGLLDEALAAGLAYAQQRPNDRDLMSAMAVVAIDAERLDLAERFAAQAGLTHEGLSTLGMLKLNANQVEDSQTLFERALAVNPDSARALLGKGLVLLVEGQAEAAAPVIEKSASLFEHHLGTWVAAGWARFVGGDYRAARANFEQAMAIDDTFAEAHGGLAVIDLMEGDIESARRRTEIALRLDRNCFSAALAKSLLLTQAGDVQAAERIRAIALNTPIGAQGQTIAKAIMALGVGRGGGARRH